MEDVEKDKVFEETTEVKDGDKSMTIPAGFKIKEGDSIDTGIVVQDRDGNEFVWVPVEDINNMVMCKDHKGSTITFDKTENTFTCTYGESETHEPTNTQLVGKLYNFSAGQAANEQSQVIAYSDYGYREPDILIGATWGDSDANLSIYLQQGLTQTAFKAQLQKEFYDMAKSVAKNKGFYIGRYETSNLNTTIIVQKDKTPTVSTIWTWYTWYKNSKEISKGALKPEEKTQNKTPSVTGSMIWGCQWDAVMNWFLSSQDVETKTYVTNSEGMGWFHENSNDTKKATGDPVGENKNEVNKIWDMAGNVLEWTMESYGTLGRIIRGGDCVANNYHFPAGYHGDEEKPTSSGSGIDLVGSRITLYVNL